MDIIDETPVWTGRVSTTILEGDSRYSISTRLERDGTEELQEQLDRLLAALGGPRPRYPRYVCVCAREIPEELTPGATAIAHLEIYPRPGCNGTAAPL